MLSKALPVAVIIFFIGIGIQPAFAIVEPKEDLLDIEPKDYLFQTIIDIANNPKIKNLLEQYDNGLFKLDVDRNVYRKLLLRNPRLFSSMIFTQPSLTSEYLEKTYNIGLEIKNILGEDNIKGIIESIEIKDKKVFDEINNIITNDEELSNIMWILYLIFLPICLIAAALILPLGIVCLFFGSINEIFDTDFTYTLFIISAALWFLPIYISVFLCVPY